MMQPPSLTSPRSAALKVSSEGNPYTMGIVLDEPQMGQCVFRFIAYAFSFRFPSASTANPKAKRVERTNAKFVRVSFWFESLPVFLV